MAAKKKSTEQERLAASLFASLPDNGGGYQVSSAFTTQERRKILGIWSVDAHTVDGQDYIESFAANALRGAVLVDPVYAVVYDFRDALCVKRVRIQGFLDLEDGRTEYSYRMSMAISWELGRGELLARPELGYQSSSLGGAPAAVKEFSASGEQIHISYRFEHDVLILEEGTDIKRLNRVTE